MQVHQMVVVLRVKSNSSLLMGPLIRLDLPILFSVFRLTLVLLVLSKHLVSPMTGIRC